MTKKLFKLFVPLNRIFAYGNISMGLIFICTSCAAQTIMAQGRSLHSFGRCSVSSDGATVVFAAMSDSSLRPGVASDIYSMHQNGSGLTRLTNGQAVDYSPWIAFPREVTSAFAP
jgi:hypothetical protein